MNKPPLPPLWDRSVTMKQLVASESRQGCAAAPRMAKIADLCDEDKAKIAKLIQQLVRVGKENEELTARLQHEKNSFSGRVARMQEEKDGLAREAAGDLDVYKRCLISHVLSQIFATSSATHLSYCAPISPVWYHSRRGQLNRTLRSGKWKRRRRPSR